MPSFFKINCCVVQSSCNNFKVNACNFFGPNRNSSSNKTQHLNQIRFSENTSHGMTGDQFESAISNIVNSPELPSKNVYLRLNYGERIGCILYKIDATSSTVTESNSKDVVKLESRVWTKSNAGKTLIEWCEDGFKTYTQPSRGAFNRGKKETQEKSWTLDGDFNSETLDPDVPTNAATDFNGMGSWVSNPIYQPKTPGLTDSRAAQSNPTYGYPGQF